MEVMSGLVIAALTGFILMIAGIILSTFPPKKINRWYGYRSVSSMKTNERWEFAQIYSGREMKKSGIMLLFFTIPVWFMNFNINEGAGALIGIIIMIALALIPIIKTEIALKKKFG